VGRCDFATGCGDGLPELMQLATDTNGALVNLKLVAALAVTFIPAISIAGAEPAGNAEVIKLDMSGPRPAVELRIADGPSRPAIFDTGSVGTVVNLQHAEALGLAREGPLAPPFDRMGISDGFQTRLRDASIGGVRLPDESVPVIPLPLPDHVAVFSPYVFSGRFVTLDFSAAEIRLSEKNAANEPKGEAYAYSERRPNLPTVPLVIAGETIHAHLDTGSGYGLIFPMSYIGRFDLLDAAEPAGKARGHNGEWPLFRARMKGEVKVGSLTLKDPEARFTDAVPNANVGMEYLRRMKITLDPQEKRLWVEPA